MNIYIKFLCYLGLHTWKEDIPLKAKASKNVTGITRIIIESQEFSTRKCCYCGAKQYLDKMPRLREWHKINDEVRTLILTTTSKYK